MQRGVPYPLMFWPEEKLASRWRELEHHVARAVRTIAPVRCHLGDLPDGFAPALDDSAWPVIQSHQRWTSQPDQIAWFRAEVEVEPALAGKSLALRFGRSIARGGHDQLAESLLYLNGRPYHGLDRNHRLVFLPPDLCQEGRFSMAVQAWSGREQYDQLYWQDPELVWVDLQTEALVYDFAAVSGTLKELDPSAPARVELLKLAEAAMGAIRWLHPGSEEFYRSVGEARTLMAGGLERLRGSDGAKPTVTHTGHTHLDVAWLWTLENIRLKTARSWSSALRLMEQYPDFGWLQSQPQLYKYIKESQPEIWAQVKQRVAEGRWEAEGGMWVEADCNLSSGESLVRQFLYGQRFFREEFGVRNTVLWLPDVFGYAWALPQIIKKSGLKYFMTTKIAWSQFNRFPNDTCKWRGIDGTEVLTHFITTPIPGNPAWCAPWMYTYNGEILPETVKGNWENYQQKNVNTETLSAYGWGDGGGGPTREMMEYAHRLADMPGIPHVRLGRVDDYFRRLEERVWNDPLLPTWNGELYLEYHRGTYTSQARQKRWNRQAEFLLQNLELFSATAALLTGAAYPRQALDESWETVLRNQFHDIIPGSSIREVYADSAAEYIRVFETAGAALQGALGQLAGAVDLPEESVIVFNPTGFTRSDLVDVELPDGLLPVDEQGQPLPVQGSRFYAPDVPACGYRAFPLRPVPPAAGPGLTVTPYLLETPHLRIELNGAGQISRLYDKQNQREVLAPGRAANLLQAFEDKPIHFDAWDIDAYYAQKGTEVRDLIEAAVEEAGPERGVLRLVWRFAESTITQRMTVYARTPRIDFETEVDWQQSQVLLKAAFPVDVHATRATYEIQFGNVERPTHWNTSWDWARFETVGHKWVDLSEGGYGVSLLNDCKYGHDIHDNILRISLIKSPVWPDATADRGLHRFLYSLYPHAEDWYRAGTAEQAYRLNNPLTALRRPAQQGALPAAFSLLSCDAPHVMIETVKEAEAGQGLVVRLYEYGNRRGPVTLSFGGAVARAVETNLIEEGEEPVAVAGHQIRFSIKPFEIRTFRVELLPGSFHTFIG